MSSNIFNMKPDNYRWIVLAQLFIGVGCTGGTYAWSVFAKPLSVANGWTLSEVTFAISLILFMVAVTGIVGGRILDRFGPTYLMLFAGILYGAGWFLVSYAQSVWQLYLTFGIVGGIGDGLLYQSSVVTASRWFPDKKGFASGIVVGAAGLAPIVIAPFAYWLLETYGVLNAFKILGLIFLVLRSSTFFLVINPPADWVPATWNPQEISQKTSTVLTTIDVGPGKMMRNVRFWLLWGGFLFGCCSGLLLISQASKLSQELAGFTSAEGAALGVGFLAFMNFTGRMVMGGVGDKIGRYRMLFIVFVITAITMFVFKFASTASMFLAVLGITACSFGAIFSNYPAITGEIFGLSRMGANYGIMFTAYGVAAFVGPMMGAYIRQTTGSYNTAFVISACFAIIALLFVFTAKKLHEKESLASESASELQTAVY